jgi:nitroreductase/NAD-dependent dihydropyrimidine dehydrogenase PreA subunit
MAWEDVKPILRPDGIHMGVMQVDKDLCTSCGLCIQNCPFSAWEMDDDDHPRMKDQYECFSCYNCKVACPVDAISIVQPYYAEEPGFWATKPHRLPSVLPLKPKDKDGKPDQWNAIERAVFERRSVRNFTKDPVPDSLIRRVLEAGRFAPSAGNCQSWKFVVITDRKLLDEIDQAVHAVVSGVSAMYRDDNLVQNLAPTVESNPDPGTWDPRLALGGFGALARGQMGGKTGGVTLNAPAVILLVSDTRSISGPQLNIGICGQNMNLVCNSLGIKACWVGLIGFLNMVPGFPEKLGIHPPWSLISSLCIGWPDFKQEGIVPREFRPVTWFRPGAEGPVEETEKGFETV